MHGSVITIISTTSGSFSLSPLNVIVAGIDVVVREHLKKIIIHHSTRMVYGTGVFPSRLVPFRACLKS